MMKKCRELAGKMGGENARRSRKKAPRKGAIERGGKDDGIIAGDGDFEVLPDVAAIVVDEAEALDASLGEHPRRRRAEAPHADDEDAPVWQRRSRVGTACLDEGSGLDWTMDKSPYR